PVFCGRFGVHTFLLNEMSPNPDGSRLRCVVVWLVQVFGWPEREVALTRRRPNLVCLPHHRVLGSVPAQLPLHPDQFCLRVLTARFLPISDVPVHADRGALIRELPSPAFLQHVPQPPDDENPTTTEQEGDEGFGGRDR